MRAQPPLEFIPPAFNPLVLRITQGILPLWLRLGSQISEIQGKQLETLVDLYQQFQEGKVRFLMAFRHPNTDDPTCMAYLIWNLVAQTARQKGISLKSPIHAHFIYDRGIPLWAGGGIGWLYSRLGGTSIQRGAMDRLGLRSARQLFASANFPLGAAPEGATNGHNEIISPLEPGIAQFGFWCVEDMQKAGRTEEVLIVPIGIQYRYLTPPWEALERLLAQLEADCGLSALSPEDSSILLAQLAPQAQLTPQELNLYQRLYRLGEHLLSLMEDFYRNFYHQTLPEPQSSDLNESLSLRLLNLLDVALGVAEEYFAIKSKGNVIDRCRRLEQAGWDHIYRQELKPDYPFSPVERGLADRVAEEADLRMWHMRLVESFVAVTGYYVREKPTVERFAETTLLLWDSVTRIKGGNPFARPKLGKQRVEMSVGEPISLSGRWAEYQSSRRQAVTQLTQDLQGALEAMIVAE